MKEMYKGKVNSPATLLVETIDSSVTSIKVADGTVFPEGPNVAVIGTDGNAETIKYESINRNILVGCVRGFQGKASVWDKDTIIARNFTEYDLNALQENILELDKKELKDFQEDENHRTVTDSEKEKWNDKVSQAQITGDVNASGSDKVWNVDFLKKQLNSKVSNKDGKNLSSNDFTDDLKNKLENIEDGANKVTKISQLTNDKNFKTESEIQELINNSTKLKKEVVISLPSTGKEDVIYLLKNKNDTNNYYTEYMWIGGKWEIIGDTKVDLSQYLKIVNLKKTELRTNKNNINVFTDRSTSDNQLDVILGDLELRTEQNRKNIKTKLSEMAEDSTHRTVTDSEKQSWNDKVDKIDGKSLSTNDYTDAAKQKVDAIPTNPKYTDTTYSNATTLSAGLMSAADKVKLNGLGGSSDLKIETASSNGITYHKYGKIVIANILFSASGLSSRPSNEKVIPNEFKPNTNFVTTLSVVSGNNEQLGTVYGRFNKRYGSSSSFDIDSTFSGFSGAVYIIGQCVYITD